VDELDDLLRRYRPSGPPSDLRDRVLEVRRLVLDTGRPCQGRHPRREWAYPFAAAVAALIFYALTDSVERRVMSATSNADLQREAAVVRITVDLGGDDVARLQAEHLMQVIESTSRLDGAAQIAASAEDIYRE
jgi:hypothetical protein